MKARENLEAGRALLGAGRLNAAASRLYYSLFQASVHTLEKLGERPDKLRSGATQWNHGMVSSNLALVGRGKEFRLLYESFRSLREEADYLPTMVDREAITEDFAALETAVSEMTA